MNGQIYSRAHPEQENAVTADAYHHIPEAVVRIRAFSMRNVMACHQGGGEALDKLWLKPGALLGA